MKISVNDQVLFTLSETQKKVIKNEINEDIFDQDMKRRLQWILTHKYEQCLKDLKQEWMSKIKQKHAMIPSDDEALANLIFADPEYKSRKQRDLETA